MNEATRPLCVKNMAPGLTEVAVGDAFEKLVEGVGVHVVPLGFPGVLKRCDDHAFEAGAVC